MDQSQFGPWPEWITASYTTVVGKPLCSADGLYDWPGVLLSHDTSDGPLRVFANLAAKGFVGAVLAGFRRAAVGVDRAP